ASELLAVSAGPDLRLATSRDAETLMATDDLPLIPSRELLDSSGRSAGYYSVWLRNDSADGMAALSDTNGVLTLLSLGHIGNSRKLIEVTVEKGRFPETSADPQLQTVAGIEGLVASIAKNATDVYTAPAIGDYGSALNYRVVVVNGNVELGSGTGYGVL